jgi:hypothetical protein
VGHYLTVMLLLSFRYSRTSSENPIVSTHLHVVSALSYTLGEEVMETMSEYPIEDLL